MVSYNRLLFIIGFTVIGAGLLWIAHNRVRIVMARGTGKWHWQRWKSGTSRMLNGENQKWDVLWKGCLGLLFLEIAGGTAYGLWAKENPAQSSFYLWSLTALFVFSIIFIVMAGWESRAAAKRVLAFPDVLEMDKQIKSLSRIIKNDAEAVEKLQPVLDLMGRIRDAMETNK